METARELADPARSCAVLIGVSAYTDPGLDDLPAVTNNLARLGELLTDPSVWGLPAGHCVQVPEPASPTEVLDAIHEAAGRAQDTLLVYYAGHGLTDGDDLLLSLPGTDLRRPYTSVDFTSVRREVLSGARQANRVMILDCCYSGRAMTGGMSGTLELAEQARIAGSYLLTASAATRQALAPPGEPYTAFTGELIRLLEDGVPGGGPLIEVTGIYDRLHSELRAKGRPLPQQRLSNSGRTLAFARNRHQAPARPVTAPGAPQVPGELRPMLWGRPREVVAHAERLRAAGRSDSARVLLTAVGRQRPAQEVAAVIARLSAEEHGDDAVLVLASMVTRGPRTIAACVEALYSLDGTEAITDDLLAHVVRGDPHEVAHTIAALRAIGHDDEAVRLIGAAEAAARGTEEILALVGALRSAGLDEDADLAVLRAAGSGPETVRLADALLAMGWRDKALDLYVQAADHVVRRPAGELVRVVRAFEEAGSDGADLIMTAAVREAVAPRDLAALCGALWAAGMDGRALTVLRVAAGTLSPDGVTELADLLRETGRDSAVPDLVRAAALAAPVGTTPRLMAALRDMGRPVDAGRLVTDAAGRSTTDVARLVRWFEEHRWNRDAKALLAAVAQRSVGARLAILDSVPGHGDGEAFFSALPALDSDEDFVAALRELRLADTPKSLAVLLAHLVRTDRTRAVGRVAVLREHLPAEGAVLAALLAATGREDGEATATAPTATEVRGLLSAGSGDIGSAAYTAAALCAAGCQAQVGRALRRMAGRLTFAGTVAWLAALRGHDLDDPARELIHGIPDQFPDSVATVITMIHEAGLEEYAAYAVGHFTSLGPERRARLTRLSGARQPASPDR
ncbi:caspase family protein [Streptomyces sp. NBC_01476]|uniref:caspase, EACC1-associated type n=1 Tax=Streptomyces sp. NBC_01476 TaxID=2903881 RepID=UPI002E2EB049|nr:caspase family protein [Streptomyces sp. NBC_01476]